MPSIINATTTNGLVTSADNSGSLQLATNSGTTAVTIDTSQNVGIGTTTPTAISGFKTLEVKGTATNSGGIFRSTSGDGTKSVLFYTGSAEAYMYTDQSIPLCFYNAGSERMRIDSSGNLLVGTTTAVIAGYANNFKASSNVMAIQRSSGTEGVCIIFVNQSGSATGNIYNYTSSTNYNTTSDYRLKENIAPMQNALNVVQQLKPVTYNWKSDGSSSQGFIAHELQEVVPDCVTGEKDAVDEEGNIKPQGIDTSFLVATLTAAIQELNAKVDAQAAEIQALKGVA